MTRPGPKPAPPGSQRTARLVVRVTPLELSAYQAAAGRAGVSMGEWVRGRALGDRWGPALAPPPVPQIQHPPTRADSQQQGDDGEDV